MPRREQGGPRVLMAVQPGFACPWSCLSSRQQWPSSIPSFPPPALKQAHVIATLNSSGSALHRPGRRRGGRPAPAAGRGSTRCARGWPWDLPTVHKSLATRDPHARAPGASSELSSAEAARSWRPRVSARPCSSCRCAAAPTRPPLSFTPTETTACAGSRTVQHAPDCARGRPHTHPAARSPEELCWAGGSSRSGLHWLLGLASS